MTRRRRLSRAHKNEQLPANAGGPGIVRQGQKTKPTKALVALVVTVAGLVGIHLTHGAAELIVGAVQLVLVVYGVWRARNAPVEQPGPGVGGFL